METSISTRIGFNNKNIVQIQKAEHTQKIKECKSLF